ncbi:dimethylamine monooxygenase subunit DmmA family protein [Neobacillus niacini]|uniref:dimethylamine monooxygenase subunit DmmA family protein n=1 Tax=Neobacillus niacini TaxID=86668 RepID=UPI003983BBE9
MEDELTLVPGKRKYLFYGDQIGMQLLRPVIAIAMEQKLNYELVLEGEQDLAMWLGEQKMGSYLYVAAPWANLKSIKLFAEGIGFSAEEAKYVGYGERSINIFCCRCHGLTEIVETAAEIPCRHCKLLLEVSDHYSTLRGAYLGYVARR